MRLAMQAAAQYAEGAADANGSRWRTLKMDG